jgi:hypothetical protein
VPASAPVRRVQPSRRTRRDQTLERRALAGACRPTSTTLQISSGDCGPCWPESAPLPMPHPFQYAIAQADAVEAHPLP